MNDKRWDFGIHTIEAETAVRYAAATLDDSPAYTGADAIAPPMVHVRLMKSLIFGIIWDEDLKLDALRLLHTQHTVQFNRPLRIGDQLHIHGALRELTEKRSGILVRAGVFADNDDECVIEGETVFFVRAKNPPPKKPRAAKPEPPPRPEPTVRDTFTVPADASYRYAEASLDNNPIHVDLETAQNAGFPDVILQGLCTMAMSVSAVLRSTADNDARRVKALSVRWTRPVLNGQNLTVVGWKEANTVHFETHNEDGLPVVVAGRVELTNA